MFLMRRICLSSVRRSGGFAIRRQKCPNLFMFRGYVIPSNQDVVRVTA